ncbi:MAG: ferrochelatase [Bryobacterales bacterium]|nr:ferrochelatase [Bryobacterales bacterium]
MPELAYDAVLVLSFGGPEKPDDVIPFLENVLRGRNVPRERMLAVAQHYYRFGGKSPINDQNRALIAGLESELARHGPRLPIYWGNRNWHPLLADTLRRMRDEGVRKALAFVTSIFSSYSGCRQYLEDVVRARAQVAGAPEVHKLRAFYNHPLFIEAQADRVREALGDSRATIVYSAHSIPLSMAETSDYQRQLHESCRLVSERLGKEQSDWRLVYQSRSGPPGQPWLEPDIAGVLREMDIGSDVVVVPIGFISDHMEVIYDLDTEAQAVARERGLNMVRAATVGVHPKFLEMIRELIGERLGLCPPRAIGQYPPNHDECPPGCCPVPARRANSAFSDSSPRAIAQR